MKYEAWENFAVFAAAVVKDKQLNAHLWKYLPVSQAWLQFIVSPPCFLLCFPSFVLSNTQSLLTPLMRCWVTQEIGITVQRSLSASSCFFFRFCFVSPLVLLVSSCFSSLHGFSMGCSPFKVVSALAWVLQLPQNVLLSWSNFFQDYFSSHIPRNVPYHVSFSPNSSFYISCISPVWSQVSFCGSFCVSCPYWLLPFPKHVWAKVACAPLTGWGFDGLIVIFIQFGCGWNWLWLAQCCSWHPVIQITPAVSYCWSRVVFCQTVQSPEFLCLIGNTTNMNLLHKIYCVWLRIHWN